MKKIILILTLLSLGVSKAQVVGGYLPLNSSKSATIGTVRTNSLVVTAPTISVNNKTLTAGNTGTVAVLSDAVFQITFNSPSTNPADGVTYYFSNLNFPAQQTSTGGTVTIPYNCTLIGWDFNMSVTGTVGSGETATLVAMVNNATVSVLSTAITFSNVSGYQGFSASGLSTNFTAGDKFNLRMISPTWATNPTQVYTGVTFWFVRRS